MALLQRTQWATLGWMIAAAGLTFAFYAREQSAFVFTVVLQEALYQLLYLLPCLLLGRLLVRRLAPHQANTTFGLISATALGLGGIGFATFGLALAGVLNGVSAWMILITALGIGLIDARDLSGALSDAPARLGRWLGQKSDGGWLWVMAATLFVIPLIGATLAPGMLWRPEDPHPYDSLIYHLQVPREWYELGRMMPLKHNVYSFFPFNAEMHYLLANHLRGGPYIAMQQNQFFSVSCTLLAAVGIWGWMKQRYPGAGAALAAVTLLSIPWILMLACVTYVESPMLLWGAMATCWLLSAISGGTRPMGSFIIAGALVGLASGAKLTGVPMLMVGLPLAALASLALTKFAQLSPRNFLLGSVIFGAMAITVLAPWLIRNQVWAGNPLFPNAMAQLGQAHFSDTQVERWERAHQPAADHASWSGRATRVATELLINWRFNYVVFPLAFLAAFMGRRRPEILALAILILMMGIFWLTATHLMGRFFILAVVPASLLIGTLPPRWLKGAAVLICLAAVNSWVGPPFAPAVKDSAQNIHQLFGKWAEQGRQGLFGLQDYTAIAPLDLLEKKEMAKEIVLVGDGQVFFQQMPMSKLRYCTVFDLNIHGDRDIFDACYAPPPAKCPWDALILIDEAEIRRLSKTYWQVPPAAEPAPGRFKNVVVSGHDD